MVKEKIIELRLVVDRAINSMKLLVPFSSAELSWTKYNLTAAKMWLGKVMQELGEENPYKNSMNTENNIIDEQTDRATDVCFTKEQYEAGHISMVKTMRVYIKEWTAVFESLVSGEETYQELVGMSHFGFGYFQQSMLSFIEAGMWLGCELHEISEREKLEREEQVAPKIYLPNE